MGIFRLQKSKLSRFMKSRFPELSEKLGVSDSILQLNDTF